MSAVETSQDRTPAHAPLLEGRRVTKLYPEGRTHRAVLREVDLCLWEPSFVAVMGPSGSGKTTLLHVLCGLDSATSGEVRFDGRELGAMDDEERTLLRRRHVGFVFQFFNLVPNLTVAENVSLPLLLEGVRRPRSDPRFQETVEFFGLADKLARRPHELSGGEMQRTSIARALVHRPRVVLADEPTGNLSQRSGREAMEFLRRAVDELGRTVLLVTHNPRDAACADEVHFLEDGRIEPERSLRGSEIDADRIAAGLEEP